jgi:hypothetical protein
MYIYIIDSRFDNINMYKQSNNQGPGWLNELGSWIT